MKKTLLSLSMAALLSACGGSGSDDSSNDTNTYSTPEKLTGSVSEISENEITVNGFKLDASRASVEYDDNTLNLADIEKGMRVDVETNRNGAATEIELDPSLVGEITAVSSDSITVNGSNIPTSSTGVQTYSSSTQYQVGQWVLVDGYLDNAQQWVINGIYDATFIHNNEAEIEGPIASLDTSNQTFIIGQTQVSYSGSTDIDDDAQLTDGLWVEVEGRFADSEFIATEIDIENDSQYSGAELEGTITWVNNEKSMIELNGRTNVAITATTRFDDGVKNDLIEGARVDVDLINGESGLEATEIEFEDGSGSQTTPTTSKKFALTGTATYIDATRFTINGFEFVVNANTRFEDSLILDSLSGVEIEVEGIEQTNGTETLYLVKEVEALETNDSDIDLQGEMIGGTIWGYDALDSSLDAYTDGTRIDVECQLVTMDSSVSSCRIDN